MKISNIARKVEIAHLLRTKIAKNNGRAVVPGLNETLSGEKPLCNSFKINCLLSEKN